MTIPSGPREGKISGLQPAPSAKPSPVRRPPFRPEPSRFHSTAHRAHLVRLPASESTFSPAAGRESETWASSSAPSSAPPGPPPPGRAEGAGRGGSGDHGALLPPPTALPSRGRKTPPGALVERGGGFPHRGGAGRRGASPDASDGRRRARVSDPWAWKLPEAGGGNWGCLEAAEEERSGPVPK